MQKETDFAGLRIIWEKPEQKEEVIHVEMEALNLSYF